MKRFAVKYGWQVMYTLNMSDRPDQIAQLIQTWDKVPPTWGPPITWVELGNEVYDVPTAAPAAQYANVSGRIIDALRKAAPGVQIGAVLTNPVNLAWDSTVYQALVSRVDFWVWHRYVPDSEYRGLESYAATVDSFHAVESDFAKHERLLAPRRLPVFITEYNLSFYDQNQKPQNRTLAGRYYLLLGNFLYLAIKYRTPVLVKQFLASAGWHFMADIEHERTGQPVLSRSRYVARVLDAWVTEQDSVGLVPQAGIDPFILSAVAGKSARGIALLVQNHDSVARQVSFDVGSGFTADSTTGVREHEGSFWTVRERGLLGGSGSTMSAPPFSITVVTFRPRRP